MSTGLLLLMAFAATGLSILNYGTPWMFVWTATALLYGALTYALY